MTSINTFQIIALTVLGLLILGTTVALSRRWITRREYFLWAFVWGSAVVATLWPDFTSVVADQLGIGRGADLVSYLGVVGMLVGFWFIYVHMRRQQREITVLVRRLAILEAERDVS